MAAPKGNKFWMKRSKHGRDKIFATPEILWEAACEYFNWCEKNPFYEAEQVKNPARPYKNDKDEWVVPDTLISLPKMRPFTFQGLCLFLHVNTVWFNKFEKETANKEDQVSQDFSQICTRIREIIYNQKFSGAASGFFNPNIICRDLGLSDKNELTGKDGKDLVPDKFEITLNIK